MSAPRTIAALALALATALPAAPARAQTKADAFAGKIPPVAGQLYRKAGRFELALLGDLSLRDAFFNKYFGGVEIGYHLTESWSLALRASSGLVTSSGSAVVCAPAGCADASETQLRQVPGRIRAVTSLAVAWSPVYGKLNVLAEKVGHFDLSLQLGLAGVAYDEVLSTGDAERLAASGGDTQLVAAPGGHVGIGARLFLTESMSARLGARWLVYPAKVPAGGSGTDWQHQLFGELGVSFFFPTRNRPTR